MFTLIAAQLYHSGSCFPSLARALATSVRSGSTQGLHVSPASGQQPALTFAACNSSQQQQENSPEPLLPQ